MFYSANKPFKEDFGSGMNSSLIIKFKYYVR